MKHSAPEPFDVTCNHLREVLRWMEDFDQTLLASTDKGNIAGAVNILDVRVTATLKHAKERSYDERKRLGMGIWAR